MAEPDDLDAVAGEFVVGTLDTNERRAFVRRMAREPMAVEAVRFWQERLAPLALAIEPVTPPQGLWGRIETSVDGSAPRGAANDNAATPWRWATMAASLVALVAAGLALRPVARPPATVPVEVRTVAFNGGIAALSPGGSEPALLVTYDKATGKLKVLPVNLPPDAKHSLELWAIKGSAAPASLGVIDRSRLAEQGRALPLPDDVTLAVSREPLGGSPTGLPTGPVLFTGKLMSIPGS